jgi:hypothetical protein
VKAADRGFSSKTRIRVIIADDHPIIRDGLRSIFESQKDFRVIAEELLCVSQSTAKAYVSGIDFACFVGW